MAGNDTVASPKNQRFAVDSAAWRAGVLAASMIAAALAGPTDAATAQEAIADARRDVIYQTLEKSPLKLDFYPPTAPATEAPPLIVWVHGGAWRSGSRASVPILELRDRGFAIASVDYRLSPVARFPAQVLDLRIAIRYLHSRAGEFGFDGDRIAIAGASAGGHLAALVGVSFGVRELEPEFDSDHAKPVRLAGIVSFYGASNLRSILGQSTPHGLSVRVPALNLLLGSQPDKAPKIAALASPLTHVSADDPPLFLLHGDADPQMPIEQSRELHEAYSNAGLQSRMLTIDGGVHGGDAFYTPEILDAVAEELRRWMPEPSGGPSLRE